MTEQTITVKVYGDTTREADETFQVTLSNATNATNATNANIEVGQAKGIITNDDSIPSITIGNVEVLRPSSVDVKAEFPVTLSAASAFPVTVSYQTVNGTAFPPNDYTATSGTVMFAPATTSQTIAVIVKASKTVVPTKEFYVKLLKPIEATLANEKGTGIILSNNRPPVITSFTRTPSDKKVKPGTEVTFQVEAKDPEGMPLAFAWSVNNKLSQPGRTENTWIWTVPTTPATGEAKIQVKVKDSFGAETSRQMPVPWAATNLKLTCCNYLYRLRSRWLG